MNRLILLILLFLIIKVDAQISLQHKSDLPHLLKETSALIYYDNLFWTINDSGGKNHLYAFNKKGEIQRIVEVEEAKNHDWEALALSEKFILIGDFGNNYGRRKDLCIYAVALKKLKQKTATVDFTITFEYPEQTSYKYKNKKTQFDCEAMAIINEEIYLFTKDWKNFDATCYKLPIQSGTQTPTKISNMNAGGLFTDATTNNGYVWLIGYYNYFPILWQYKIGDWSKPLYKHQFTKYKRYQVEGIENLNDTLFITTEKSAIEQSLLLIPINNTSL